MQYNDLAELRDGYAKGEVTAPLVLDDETTDVCSGGDLLFAMHPAELLEQALRLLGIPFGHA